MTRRIVGRAVAIFGFGLIVAACGGSQRDPGSQPALVCDAGAKRCEGQSIKVCDASGRVETTEQTCQAGQSCRVEGDTVFCQSQACTPSALLCDGSVATKCKVDGTGLSAGGTDCDALGQKCAAGVCVAPTCESGNQLCMGGDLYSCREDGMGLSLEQDCSADELCDSSVGKCLARVCTANEGVCEGTVAKTCNATGSAWLDSEDCADDDRTCVKGKCNKPQMCNPVQRYCQDGNVFQCDLDGQTLSLSQTCESSKQHCATTGVYAFCTQDVCLPGQKMCDKNTAKICSDEGSLSAEGTDCGNDAWCEEGTCTPRTCTPETYYCNGSNVYYCQSDAPPTLLVTCGDALTCRAIPGVQDPEFGTTNALCAPLPCTPGGAACLLNKLGTCANDGASLSAVTSDCTATSNVCTPDAKCAATATDTFGVDENVQPVYAGNFVGDMIAVTSARKLTELGMWLVFQSSRELRWVIYEQTGSAFVAKVDKVVTVASSTGWVSAPGFAYQLQVGKVYLLGVVVSGGGATHSLDIAPFAQPSFGTLLGWMNSAYSTSYYYLDSFADEGVAQLRVTTAFP